MMVAATIVMPITIMTAETYTPNSENKPKEEANAPNDPPTKPIMKITIPILIPILGGLWFVFGWWLDECGFFGSQPRIRDSKLFLMFTFSTQE
jgi:hypothetical protein